MRVFLHVSAIPGFVAYSSDETGVCEEIVKASSYRVRAPEESTGNIRLACPAAKKQK